MHFHLHAGADNAYDPPRNFKLTDDQIVDFLAESGLDERLDSEAHNAALLDLVKAMETHISIGRSFDTSVAIDQKTNILKGLLIGHLTPEFNTEEVKHFELKPLTEFIRLASSELRAQAEAQQNAAQNTRQR